MTVLVHLIVVLGMLVIVPAGLRMLDDPHPLLRSARRWWPLGAVAGATSLWLARGPGAAGLATIYALAAALLAGYAAARLLQRHSLAPVEVAVLTALISPAVAAAALVAERAGFQLFGFKLTVLTLTVAHFHFAGFAAALIAGLVARATRDQRTGGSNRAADCAALTVPTGTLLVLIGYFTGDAVELAGAVVLTTGMWTVSWLTWRHGRTRTADRPTAVLLTVSAAVLLASMVLALSWAVGEATGLPHPTLAWMAATHGVANALGFALCALVGWRRTGTQV